MSRTPIDFNGIDGAYPVAGQDNNSQGFRDNFTYIKAGLEIADGNFQDLYNTTVRRDNDNNLNKARLYNASVNQLFSEVYNSGMITSDPGITVQGTNAVGEYHKYSIGGNLWITFGGWPKDADDNPLYGKIRLELVPTSTTVQHTVEIVSSPPGAVYMLGTGVASTTLQLPVATSTPDAVSVVYDIWSYDGGDTVYIQKVSQFTSA